MKSRTFASTMLVAIAAASISQAATISLGDGVSPEDIEENPTNRSGNIVLGDVLVVNLISTNFRDGSLEVNSSDNNDTVSASGSLLVGTQGGVPTLAPEARGANGELLVSGPTAKVEVQRDARIGSSNPYSTLFPNLSRGGVGAVIVENGGTVAIAPNLDEVDGDRGGFSVGEVTGSFTSNGNPISLDVNGPDEHNGTVVVTGQGSNILAGSFSLGSDVNADGSTGMLSVENGGAVIARNQVSLGEAAEGFFSDFIDDEFDESTLAYEEGRVIVGFGSEILVTGENSSLQAGQLLVGYGREEDQPPAGEVTITGGGSFILQDYSSTDYVIIGEGGNGVLKVGDFDGSDSGLTSQLSISQSLEEFTVQEEFDGEIFEFQDEREAAVLSSLGGIFIGANKTVVLDGQLVDQQGDGTLRVGRNGLVTADVEIEVGGESGRGALLGVEDTPAKGELIVSDGGVVRVGFKTPGFNIFNVGDVNINQNGRLSGNGGTIDANVVLNGGTIAPGASPGILNIDGDLEILDGLLEIEIAGTGAGMFDQLNITGDLIASMGFNIEINFLDGFAPQPGDTFNFLNVDGDSSILDTPSLINFSVKGGGVFGNNAQLDFASGSLSLTGGTSVAPVPLPAGLPMLMAGIVGLGWLGKRRMAMSAT